MRVAYVCADRGIPVFGQKGCSVHVQEVIRGLLKRGIEVKLFASNLKGERPADFQGVEVYKLPQIPHQHDPDFAGSVDNMNAALADALQQEGPFDFVYERYSLWSQAAMEYAHYHKIPGLLEVNAPLIHETETHRTLEHKDLARTIEQAVFDRASQLVCVSREVSEYVAAVVADKGPGTIQVIPNGINPQRFARMDALRQRYHNDQRVTIGFVGTLKPWHGISTLMAAFQQLIQRHTALRLLIVGDGPEKDNLLAEIDRLALDNKIALIGAVHPSVVPECLSMMDIAVAPYPALEHFYFSPLKVYEYMAAGLPVIVSRIGQLEHLITDQQNGLFFTPGNASSLAAKMDRLIGDPALQKRMGRAARAKVLAEHTWDHVTQRILAIVDKSRNQWQVAS